MVRALPVAVHTITLFINWSTSELNRQLNPTTCLGDTDCWIQQSVSPKQVVGFSCLFNSEVDQLINKVIVCTATGKALTIFTLQSAGTVKHLKQTAGCLA